MTEISEHDRKIDNDERKLLITKEYYHNDEQYFWSNSHVRRCDNIYLF